MIAHQRAAMQAMEAEERAASTSRLWRDANA
jgi:hypothetical protein